MICRIAGDGHDIVGRQTGRYAYSLPKGMQVVIIAENLAHK